MESHLLGGLKDFATFTLSYCVLNLLLVEPVIITGCFALAGVVLGRVLDWVREDWKARRKQKKAKRLPKP